MLVMCLTLLTPISAFADNLANGSSDSSSFITNPYEYPITPDSPQWRNFTQTSQMIEACQVPEDIVENMTTEALLETVLDYPLMVNVLVQNTPEIGYKFLLENNAAFRELVTRNDMIDVVDDKLFSEKLRSTAVKTDSEIVSETGLRMIYNVLAAKNSAYVAKASQVTNNNVKTPKGSKVPHYENLTWADHDTTSAAATSADNQLARTYPSATKISGPKPAYNCHSYAWHSTSTSNKYWIDSPTLYWSDGSYKVTSSPKNADKVVYLQGSSVIHSAIYFNAPTKLVQSKWGYAGVYRHQQGYGPYAGSTYRAYTRA